MNLGEVADSPWGDVASSTPTTDTAPNDQEPPEPSTPPKSPAPVSSAPIKTPGGRASRTPRRHAAQSTRLEALDDDLGPLGPLGATTASAQEPDEPPELPQKERQGIQSSRLAASPQLARGRGVDNEDQEEYDDDGTTIRARMPPPVQPHTNDGSRRQTQPSVSIEQAARPTFHISVGDPHKVGDLTSSHTVFQVRTKTTSKAYRNPEFEVSRRYRDFLWLYDQLHSNNPGVVVPPPPEKQAVGRFDTNFVETRRSALERMLNKTATHLILQHDGDLKIFLESETFNVDVKNRARKDPDMPVESKGMFSSLNLSVGSGTKFVEHDDWFLDRRVYLDTLEKQLQGLLKATDTSIGQRKALSDACADLSVSLNTLSQVELSPSLSAPLASLSDLQLRIRDLYARQAQQDVLTLGNVIEEYIRIIGSIKKAFEQRQRSWQTYHNAESDLQKRRSALDKLARQGRTQQDRLSQLQADVGDAERRAHQARLAFDDLGKGMRAELERFEKEKVEDFRAGVETYLESAVEAQKELIECWETFLMHMDADEEAGTQHTDPLLAGNDNGAAGQQVASSGTASQQQQQGFAAAECGAEGAAAGAEPTGTVAGTAEGKREEEGEGEDDVDDEEEEEGA